MRCQAKGTASRVISGIAWRETVMKVMKSIHQEATAAPVLLGGSVNGLISPGLQQGLASAHLAFLTKRAMLGRPWSIPVTGCHHQHMTRGAACI